LRTAPEWLAGQPPVSHYGAQRGKDRKRQAVYGWAQATYELLRDDFPGLERELCPYSVRWGHSDFFLAFDEEVGEHGTDAYLDHKVVFLAGLLRDASQQLAGGDVQATRDLRDG
jgi:hypothetical protein